RLRRARVKPLADHGIDRLGRAEGEDRLALRGAIGGLAQSEIGAHADRLGALEKINVHDLRAVADREGDGLVCGLGAREQVRGRAETCAGRRTRGRSGTSAMPSRYLPLTRSCSSRFSATSVVARRCAVLLATPSRFASVLMPSSTSSSEKALSSSIAVATDES